MKGGFISLTDVLIHLLTMWLIVWQIDWLSYLLDWISLVPPRRVSVLVKVNVFPGHSSEVGLHEELEELWPIDGPHGIAQTHHTGTQRFLHVVEAIGHAVDGIDHEAHLGVLCILLPQRIPLWERRSRRSGLMTDVCSCSYPVGRSMMNCANCETDFVWCRDSLNWCSYTAETYIWIGFTTGSVLHAV